MDNAYYTGATLVRAGNLNGGGNNCNQVKYASFSGNTRTAGTPPLPSPTSCPLQPNHSLLTGLPLIRNGQHLQSSHSGHGPQGPPPGVICCFQPIYYIPTPSPPTTVYNSPIILPSNVNKQNTCLGSFQQQNGKGVGQGQKRRNYKSLIPNHLKLKPVHSSPPPLTSHTDRDFYQNQASFNPHRKLAATSSYSDPISPPVKVVHQVLTRTTSNFHFFGSDDPDSISEEKQRNDKLLNFYFEKHWRPRDDEEEGAWNDQLNRQNIENEANNNNGGTVSSSWDVMQPTPMQRALSSTQIIQSEIDATTVTTSGFDRQPGAGRLTSSSPPANLKQKDLEVEAQIITLANGHRDLEIRLCYVTS